MAKILESWAQLQQKSSPANAAVPMESVYLELAPLGSQPTSYQQPRRGNPKHEKYVWVSICHIQR